jgi:hypothetical protein
MYIWQSNGNIFLGYLRAVLSQVSLRASMYGTCYNSCALRWCVFVLLCMLSACPSPSLLLLNKKPEIIYGPCQYYVFSKTFTDLARNDEKNKYIQYQEGVKKAARPIIRYLYIQRNQRNQRTHITHSD